MGNLLAMIAFACATAALWLISKWTPISKHPITVQAAFIAGYSLTILLALRFDARTYPGISMGSSGVLNAIFNSNSIFYLASGLALVGALIDLLVLLRASNSGSVSASPVRGARLIRTASLALATLTAVYGIGFAIMLERLP
jgi:hypothetical protein